MVSSQYRLHRARYLTRLTKTTKRCSRRSHSTPPTLTTILICPLPRLLDDQRHGRGQRRPEPYPSSVAWYCKDPTCPEYWSSWSCKSNFWLHLYETAVHHVDVQTHIYTHIGRTSRAGEGVES